MTERWEQVGLGRKVSTGGCRWCWKSGWLEVWWKVYELRNLLLWARDAIVRCYCCVRRLSMLV